MRFHNWSRRLSDSTGLLHPQNVQFLRWSGRLPKLTDVRSRFVCLMHYFPILFKTFCCLLTSMIVFLQVVNDWKSRKTAAQQLICFSRSQGFTATQRTNNNDFKKTQSEALEFHDQEMKNMKIFQMNIKTFI